MTVITLFQDAEAHGQGKMASTYISMLERNDVTHYVFFQDAEAHGQGKMVSAYIAMLERNDVDPKRGDFLLRYAGATLDHADKVLNKALFKDMKVGAR